MNAHHRQSESSAAILGWNGQDGVGYAVRGEDAWTCVGRDAGGEARRAFRASDTAPRSLRKASVATHFESVTDREELTSLLSTSRVPCADEEDDHPLPRRSYRPRPRQFYAVDRIRHAA